MTGVQCNNFSLKPGQTYDIIITKENLADRSVRLVSHVGTQPICTVIDKGDPGVKGTPFLERQGNCNMPIEIFYSTGDVFM